MGIHTDLTETKNREINDVYNAILTGHTCEISRDKMAMEELTLKLCTVNSVLPFETVHLTHALFSVLFFFFLANKITEFSRFRLSSFGNKVRKTVTVRSHE